MNSEIPGRYKVWDAPIRIVHWLLVLGIVVQYGSAKFEWFPMQWHVWGGYLILALLVFRVLWGLFGSDTARFSEFVRGPSAIKAYLEGAPVQPGHNPLGALSVLALVGLLLLQSVSGLFANDEIAIIGPLAAMVSPETAHGIAELHELGEGVIPALIALHLVAVLYYRFVKHRDLIKPMITGTDQFADAPRLKFASNRRAVVLALIALCLLAAIHQYGLNHPADLFEYSD